MIKGKINVSKTALKGIQTMTYAIALILLLNNFLYSKRKIPFLSFAVFIWMLCGWCFSNADTMIYELRYSYDMTVTQEPIFMAFIYICRLLGCDFAQYRIIYTGIFLAILFCTMYKYSENYNLVIVLYFLFPFWYDAVQLRQFGGNVLAVTGIMHFITRIRKESNIRKKDICELLLWLIAALCVHVAAIYYFIVFLAMFCDMYMVMFITALICLMLFVVLTPDVILLLTSMLHIPQKGYTLLAIMNRVTDIQIERYLIFYLFGLCGAAALIVMNNKLKGNKTISEDRRATQFLIKCHILSMTIIPFILHGAIDFVRIQYPLILLTHIYISHESIFRRSAGMKCFIFKKNDLLFSLMSLIYVFVLLYFWILSNQNIATVFRAIMENNLIFSK